MWEKRSQVRISSDMRFFFLVFFLLSLLLLFFYHSYHKNNCLSRIPGVNNRALQLSKMSKNCINAFKKTNKTVTTRSIGRKLGLRSSFLGLRFRNTEGMSSDLFACEAVRGKGKTTLPYPLRKA